MSTAADPTLAASPLAFTAYIRLESVDPPRNRARFWTLQYTPTLWGGVVLVRTWGRIGTPGRSQRVLGDEVMARQLLRRRLLHGYRVAAWQ